MDGRLWPKGSKVVQERMLKCNVAALHGPESHKLAVRHMQETLNILNIESGGAAAFSDSLKTQNSTQDSIFE